MSAAVYGQAGSAVDNRTVAGARQLYDQHGKSLAEKRDNDIAALGANYTKSLQAAADQAQKAGQLEPLLAMRHELERFAKEGAAPPVMSGDAAPALARWREAYNREYTRIQADHEAAMAPLTKRYLEHLDFMKQDLTKTGNVKEALAFMQEYERVKRDTAPSASAPVTIPASPLETPAAGNPVPPLELLRTLGLDRRVVSFEGERTGGFAGAASMSPSATLEVTHEERSRVSDEGIQLMGGRTVITGVDDLLLAACQAAQAITITAELAWNASQVRHLRALHDGSGGRSQDTPPGAR